MAAGKKIVIVGGGFAGLTACDFLYGRRSLIRREYDVILVDRKPTFDFLPLSPDVLAGWLRPGSARIDLGKFAEDRGFEFRQMEIDRIEPDRNLLWSGDRQIVYDFAIIAAGADVNFFGDRGLEQSCYTLNSVQDALKIRTVILERPQNNRCVNIVVVGGGYTGLEVAMNSHYLLRLRRRAGCRIIVVEKQQEILPGLPQRLKETACRELKKRGIETATADTVTKYESGNVIFGSGRKIEDAVCVWSAGVHAPRFLRELDAPKSKGRIKVNETLSIEGKPYSNLFFSGDCCAFSADKSGEPLRMAVMFSIGQAKIAAQNIVNHLSDTHMTAYKPADLGYLIPLTYGKAPGMVMGLNVGPGTGFLLHYLMNIYRSPGRKKAAVAGDLVIHRLLKM